MPARRLDLPSSPHHSGLSVQERRFVSEYCIDGDGTAAAIRAGYPRRSAAGVSGSLLSRDAVKAAIAHEMELMAKRARIDQDWVIERYRRIADVNIKDVLSWSQQIVQVGEDEETGAPIVEPRTVIQLKDSDEIPDEVAAAISEIQQTKDGSFKFKLHDKQTALGQIGKQLGMFVDRKEIEHKGEIGVEVKDSREVAKALAAILARRNAPTIEHEPQQQLETIDDVDEE